MSRKAVRCRFVVFLLTLGLAGVPNETGAQDRRSHWGVTVGFSPRWTTPEALDTLLERLWDGSSIDFSGSEFRAGFVRGSELGGDAGVSFVRQPFNDGSELASAGVGYVTRGVVLTGVEAHKFTPFGVIRDRVQIGVDYGAGLGVFKGVVDAATAEGAGSGRSRPGCVGPVGDWSGSHRPLRVGRRGDCRARPESARSGRRQLPGRADVQLIGKLPVRCEMKSRTGFLLVVLLPVLLGLPRLVVAQTAVKTNLDTLEVTGTPAGLLAAAGITTPVRGRAELFFHLIHHLYGMPGDDSPAVRGMRRYARTLAAFTDAWRRVRQMDETAGLQAAQDNRRARGRLEDLVEAAGFRLRRRSGRHVVEREDGNAAAARRGALRDAGLDVEDLDARLNNGEALTFEFPSFRIPSPLGADVWLETVFGDRETEASLGLRLLTDRRAALLYYGLTSMTPETLRFLGANPRLLRELYEDHGDALATYGRSLVVEDGRIVAPGGPEAAELWRSLTSERVDDADDFIKAILRHDEGRLAFVYDFVAHLDEPRQRFVLGLWLDERRRRSRFWRLYDVILASARLLPDRPFVRTYPEPSVLLSQVAVAPSGRPTGLVWTGLWDEAFSGSGLPRNPERDLRNVERSEPIDAAWLAERVFEDSDRLAARAAAFLFAQRRFGDAAAGETGRRAGGGARVPAFPEPCADAGPDGRGPSGSLCRHGAPCRAPRRDLGRRAVS